MGVLPGFRPYLALSVVGVVPVKHVAAHQDKISATPHPEPTDQLEHRLETDPQDREFDFAAPHGSGSRGENGVIVT